MLYPVNEFLVCSEVPLSDTASPGALPCGGSARPTVHLRRGSLADMPCLLRKLRRQLVYDVGDGFIVEPKEGVALHVDMKGETITLDCADELLPKAISWAFHAGLGAATLAHGGLPLHGTGLEVNGRYIGVMADSRGGKSTLAWRLLECGFRFGSDDLIPVRVGAAGIVAYPSISLYPRLRGGAIARLGLDPAALLPLYPDVEEPSYYAPLSPAQRVVEEQELSVIFVLQPEIACGGACCDGDGATCHCAVGSDLARDEIVSCRLTVEEATYTIHANLHANWLIGKWLDQRKLARLSAEVAARVPVYTLRYIRSYEILPRLAGTIRDLTARSSMSSPPSFACERGGQGGESLAGKAAGGESLPEGAGRGVTA